MQARGHTVDSKTKAFEIKAEVKLQRGILEPHIENHMKQQRLEGGMAMSHMQTLMASGMTSEEAMLQVGDKVNMVCSALLSMFCVRDTQGHVCPGADLRVFAVALEGRDESPIRNSSEHPLLKS